MRKFLLFFFVLLFFQEASSFAQTRYIIRLKNKVNNPYSLNDPGQYLSQRSIDRRNLYNLPIDSTDLPITPAYIDSIRLSGDVTILNVSKWLNLVSIKTSDAAAIVKINSFPFVASTSASGARPQSRPVLVNKELELQIDPINPSPLGVQNITDYYSYGQAFNQIHLNNGEFLHNHGFRGEQMQLALLDAGFLNYKTLSTFDSVRNNNRVLGTWDFVTNDTSVNEDYLHGMECFSTIAANLPGTFVGTAPQASFYLYRTEDVFSETVFEELNWAAGAEKADSLGVDVISSSLGYNTFDGNVGNHTYSDMNGDISICARATDMAAKKGMLVLNAVGNEGDKTWHYLVTPADADSCMAIGAVSINKTVAVFSSYGPSSDGQIKPDVAAMGVNVAIANTTNGLPEFGNGTSFATPVIAGMATCLWQAFPEVNNMTIIDAFRQSADRYNNPDTRTGYGIPDVKKAFVDLVKQLHTQQVDHNKCAVTIKWAAKCAADMNFVVERKLPTDNDYIAVATKTNTGNFAKKNFIFYDDLSSVTEPATIHYRIKMNIGIDTTFYLDSTTVNYTEPCTTYTFIGDGNWDIVTNWSNNTIPPGTLPAGSKIIIDPILNGECILNQTQYVSPGAIFIVLSDKKLLVEGKLEIQE